MVLGQSSGRFDRGTGPFGDVFAWAYWTNWRSGTEMVARAAHAAIWAVRDEGIAHVTCRIDVDVLGDRESFESPGDFRHHVTSQALHRFGRIGIAVGDPSITVTIEFLREPNPATGWAGTLLTVSATGAQFDEERCGLLRDRISTAIERGRPRQSPEVLTGDSRNSPDVPVAVQEHLSERTVLEEQRLITGLAWPFLLVPTVVLFPEAFDGLFTQRTPEAEIIDPSGNKGYEILWPPLVIAMGILAGIGYVIGTPWLRFKRPPPYVVIDRPSRVLSRLRSLGAYLVSSIIGLGLAVGAAAIGLKT
jgi:hypothetical protein